MSLTYFKILILICGLCSRLHTLSDPSLGTLKTKDEVQYGSDVTLRCDVPLLPESSTLEWIKDGGQTSNTTLVYNNSAYIILHNVDENSKGKYYCNLTQDGKEETVIDYILNVTTYSQNKKLTIYRHSSDHSDLSLICKSKKTYDRLRWIWEQRPKSQKVLIDVERGREVQVEGQIKPGRHSSNKYNGSFCIFHISPVKFNYSGTYRSFPNDNDSPYTTTILHTIRVSVEPPAGELRNQSAVLTCEVSDVSDSVTLVWLRMQGNRGVLVKQQILNEENKIILTVNLTSRQSDLLHWQCAVFTENTLRAVAPITISLTSSTTNALVIKYAKITTVTVLAVLFAGILLGILLYYWYRKQMSGVTAGVLSTVNMQSVSEESEPVYINICRTRERYSILGNRNQRPESQLGRNRHAGQNNYFRRDETPGASESVTYATIYFNKCRFSKTSPYTIKDTG